MAAVTDEPTNLERYKTIQEPNIYYTVTFFIILFLISFLETSLESQSGIYFVRLKKIQTKNNIKLIHLRRPC